MTRPIDLVAQIKDVRKVFKVRIRPSDYHRAQAQVRKFRDHHFPWLTDMEWQRQRAREITHYILSGEKAPPKKDDGQAMLEFILSMCDDRLIDKWEELSMVLCEVERFTERLTISMIDKTLPPVLQLDIWRR